jgi:hypothetical protein
MKIKGNEMQHQNLVDIYDQSLESCVKSKYCIIIMKAVLDTPTKHC